MATNKGNISPNNRDPESGSSLSGVMISSIVASTSSGEDVGHLGECQRLHLGEMAPDEVAFLVIHTVNN